MIFRIYRIRFTSRNIITVSLVLIKLLTSFIYNEELLGIIRYAKTNFWHSNYDTCEKSIMNKCQRTCNYLVFVFTFFAQGTVLGFILRPILGKSDIYIYIYIFRFVLNKEKNEKIGSQWIVEKTNRTEYSRSTCGSSCRCRSPRISK